MTSLTANRNRILREYPCGGIKEGSELPGHAEPEEMTPALFVEVYRMHFSTNYDMGQESSWHWLTNEHICDFTTPCFTKEQLLHPCMVRRKGHRLKMLSWMLEEYLYILGHLQDEDCDGCIVLVTRCSCWCRATVVGNGEVEGAAVPHAAGSRQSTCMLP